jgi:hypothetical protein
MGKYLSEVDTVPSETTSHPSRLVTIDLLVCHVREHFVKHANLEDESHAHIKSLLNTDKK